MNFAAAALLGYVIGAAPIIYIVGRARGINLHTVGTGNIGAGNLWRHGGFAIGALSVTVEVGKGAVAVLAANALLASDATEWTAATAGIFAVVGQMWPATLRFQGGRGNGTAAGALLSLHPEAFAVGFGVFLILSLRKVVRIALPGGGTASPRSRTVPIAVIMGMGLYLLIAGALNAPVPALTAAILIALTLFRRATAPWPPDPETGLKPQRSLLATILYDRPDFSS